MIHTTNYLIYFRQMRAELEKLHQRDELGMFKYNLKFFLNQREP